MKDNHCPNIFLKVVLAIKNRTNNGMVNKGKQIQCMDQMFMKQNKNSSEVHIISLPIQKRMHGPFEDIMGK